MLFYRGQGFCNWSCRHVDYKEHHVRKREQGIGTASTSLLSQHGESPVEAVSYSLQTHQAWSTLSPKQVLHIAKLPTSGRLPQLLHKALQFTLFTSCGNSDVMFALLHGPQNIALERNTLQNLRGAGLAHKTVHTEQDVLQVIGRPGKTWHGMLKACCVVSPCAASTVGRKSILRALLQPHQLALRAALPQTCNQQETYKAFDLKACLDALLQRAGLLQLELPAYRPQETGHKERAALIALRFALTFQSLPAPAGFETGNTNCFYQRMLTVLVEGLCLGPQPVRIAALFVNFTFQHSAAESCPFTNHEPPTSTMTHTTASAADGAAESAQHVRLRGYTSRVFKSLSWADHLTVPCPAKGFKHQTGVV
ncbi:MAG: hypothetical protein FRX49_09586 [Trebouxia sp. A1-2]|nr:MAG: hypothetical protein FRX49_09586 [Trebouxia sp. A1-2]